MDTDTSLCDLCVCWCCVTYEGNPTSGFWLEQIIILKDLKKKKKTYNLSKTDTEFSHNRYCSHNRYFAVTILNV